jgi:hypothetical protein
MVTTLNNVEKREMYCGYIQQQLYVPQKYASLLNFVVWLRTTILLATKVCMFTQLSGCLVREARKQKDLRIKGGS